MHMHSQIHQSQVSDLGGPGVPQLWRDQLSAVSMLRPAWQPGLGAWGSRAGWGCIASRGAPQRVLGGWLRV